MFDNKGRRLIWVATYLENGRRRWAGIARSGNWANSFWVSNTRRAFERKAQALFDQRGQRLVYVTTYGAGASTRWVGIARSGNWANSFWVSSSLASFSRRAQQLFDKKGRRLVHLHSFLEGRRRYWAGIARSGNWANSFFVSNDLDSFNRQAQHLFEDAGRRLVAVEYLDDCKAAGCPASPCGRFHPFRSVTFGRR